MTKINKPVLDMQGTGEKIKSLRKFNKISVSALQEVFGMANPQAIYNWESGKNMPSIDNLIVLAQVFDVTIESLIATNRVEVEVETASLINLKSA
ncbi:MAG: helix-turn-helix domain-containing protein [Treponema sp.]|nr:helix-turn-helix domain-containing protein [Treponema sp.]